MWGNSKSSLELTNDRVSLLMLQEVLLELRNTGSGSTVASSG